MLERGNIQMKKFFAGTLILSIIGMTLVGCNSDDSRDNHSSNIGKSSEYQSDKSGKGIGNSTGEKNNYKSEIFSPEDAMGANIKIDMDKSEVDKILGKPQKVESNYEAAFGADILVYHYEFGSVRFEPLDNKKYSVSRIKISKPGTHGPRDIQVGDNTDAVLGKFVEKLDATRREGFLYGKQGENHGLITCDKSGKPSAITFSYGGGGFGTYTLSMEVEDGKIKSISIAVMNV